MFIGLYKHVDVSLPPLVEFLPFDCAISIAVHGRHGISETLLSQFSPQPKAQLFHLVLIQIATEIIVNLVKHILRVLLRIVCGTQRVKWLCAGPSTVKEYS